MSDLIYSKIRQYRDGEMTQADLVHYLAFEHKYAPGVGCPYKAGTVEWWEWRENIVSQPGTFDDVVTARDTGRLDWGTFNLINDALYERAISERRIDRKI